MKRLGWIIIFFCFSLPVLGGDLLTQFCDRTGGEIVRELSCDKRKIRWKSNYCVLNDSVDRKMFFNGCSGPSGGFAELFYPSCIKHDLCYHHEPATSGLKKSDCDNNFRKDLIESCDQARHPKYCKAWAKIMYEGVKVGGSMAYNCHNNVASYFDIKF